MEPAPLLCDPSSGEALHASGEHCARAYAYDPELSTAELIIEVQRLFATERRVERLICRYLADLADRVQHRQDNVLWAYSDELHAARCLFGLGVRETRERVRVGRALRQLPRIEQAFIAAELSYSRVREVTRVAEPQTELDWLSLARTLDHRALERRVAATNSGPATAPSHDAAAGQHTVAEQDAVAGQDTILEQDAVAGQDTIAEQDAGSIMQPLNSAESRGIQDPRSDSDACRLDKPARTEWLSQNALRVTFELTAEAWGLLERALEGARHSASTRMSDPEALLAIARDALSAQTQAPDASDPRCSIVLYECQRCSRNELDTGVGLLELDPSAAASLGCGANEIHLPSEGRAIQRGGPLPAATRRAVMLRDHSRCRVPGCNRRRYVDVHHSIPQANGGSHSRANCFVLCTTHHRLLHEGKLHVTGDADAQLSFRDSRGRPLVAFGAAPPDDAPVVGEVDGTALSSERRACHDDPAASTGQAPATPLALEQPGGTDVNDATTHSGSPIEPTAHLLQIIGRRGGWSSDALIEASGLPASLVASALTLLELDGRLRHHDFGFDPV